MLVAAEVAAPAPAVVAVEGLLLLVFAVVGVCFEPLLLLLLLLVVFVVVGLLLLLLLLLLLNVVEVLGPGGAVPSLLSSAAENKL